MPRDLAPAGRRTDRVIVLGAGVAGLAAALELSHAGREVLVLEAAAAPGGKMRAIPSPAGEIDGGPTVFTMRPVFEELFEAVGESFAARVPAAKAEVLARHWWGDGAPGGAAALDLFADPAESEAAVAAAFGPAEAARLAAFDAQARLLFDAFEGPVMRAPAPTPLGVTRAVMADALRLLPAMAPAASLWSALGRRFGDPRLRQLFGRYATYVGGSPLLSPALLMLVWRSEANGVWIVEGGMRRLARTLAELAEARGTEIRCNAPVAEITVQDGRATGVRLAGGETIPAAAVLHAGDPSALGAGLLGAAARPAAREAPRARRGQSAWVWTFAGRPSGRAPSHHTVAFGDDYPAEFRDVFDRRRPPADPTVYVCAQDRAATRDAPAPEGAERLLLLLNAPADGDLGPPSPEEIERCTTATFRRLAACGLALDPPQGPGVLTTPEGFARMFPGTGGGLYGAAPHGAMATFQRPTARSRIAGLYLAGGGCHPGPGVPMAVLSGRHAAAAIMTDRASTSTWAPGATPGGTSTG